MDKFIVLYEKLIIEEQKNNFDFGLDRHTEMALLLILTKHKDNSYLNYLINAKFENGEFTKTFRQQDVLDESEDTYIIWHLLQPCFIFWRAYQVYQLGMTFEEYLKREIG